MNCNNLYPSASIIIASKNKRRFKEEVSSVIIHGTGDNNPTLNTVRYLTKPNTASAHIVIGRDGRTYQLVPFDREAWHAGVSEWDGKKSLNKRSIGIELCNSLSLLKTSKGFTDKWGHDVPESEVFEWKGGYWQNYTEAQYMALDSVIWFLTVKLGILELLGHEQISPGRKVDPGPAFQWHFFRKDNL